MSHQLGRLHKPRGVGSGRLLRDPKPRALKSPLDRRTTPFLWALGLLAEMVLASVLVKFTRQGFSAATLLLCGVQIHFQTVPGAAGDALQSTAGACSGNSGHRAVLVAV